LDGESLRGRSSLGLPAARDVTTISESGLSNTVRVVEIDGQPWFVAADVCKALDLKNPTVAIKSLDEDERSKKNLGLRGLGAAIVVTEPGLYKLSARSSKPEAKAFDRWVRHEVLPAIRKDGMYVAGEEKVKTGEISE
jgi:prophage antirepressor-like protein